MDALQTILVAEDHELNRTLIVRQLARIGYAADVAEDGMKAHEMYRGKDYALVLTDCHMPNLDGFGLTAAIRAHEGAGRGRTPVIALTGSAGIDDAQQCLDAGMDDVIAKPVTLNALKDIIGRWIGAPAPAEQG